jgi:thiosulfate dehydrogenase (quinone) large subunit
MIGTWLREATVASYLLTVARLWLGYQWLMAGWHKVAGEFSAAGFLRGAIANSQGERPLVQAWWASFLENFALPNAALFEFMVAWGEVLVGIGLIVGAFSVLAVFFGMLMNFSFLLSGAISVNPQMILVSFILLSGGRNTGILGLDRWIMPFLRARLPVLRNQAVTSG